MLLSAKIEYACLAAVALASRHGGTEPVPIRDIAEQHGIPSPFLVQILLQLKSAGLVRSTRGAGGGYHLTKSPAEISLRDVTNAVDGKSFQQRSSAGTTTHASRLILATWQRIADAERRMLDEVSLADLVESLRGEAHEMYHI